MSDVTLSQGGWVKPFALDNFLSKKISDRSLKGKYMECFNEKFPSGRASDNEFKKWAKEDLIKKFKSNQDKKIRDYAKKVADII